MTRDEWRSACLLFSEEIADGAVRPEDLDRRDVAEAVADKPIPSRFSRRLQRRQMERGRLAYEDDVVAPLAAARAAVLGPHADGPPRFLLRVDGFPHDDAAPGAPGAVHGYRRAHAILREAAVPYLLSVSPLVARDADDPAAEEWRPHSAEEREALADARRDGVAFGTCGLDRRTRHADAQRRSELVGLGRKETAQRLDRAQAIMREEALHADVFVAPFDRFERSQYASIAERWDVVTGGPGSVEHVGFHRTPLWRGDAVYLPAYPPLHGRAADVIAGVRTLTAARTAVWAPVVVDWRAEELRGFDDLVRLAEALTGLARPWDEFLAAVDMSRRVGELALASAG